MEADLRHLLDELNRTLERLERHDPARQEIEHLAGTVERRLANPADHDDASFGDHLQEVSVRFDADHPGLGGALRTVISGLGSAGI